MFSEPVKIQKSTITSCHFVENMIKNINSTDNMILVITVISHPNGKLSETNTTSCRGLSILKFVSASVLQTVQVYNVYSFLDLFRDRLLLLEYISVCDYIM